jgi:hypothetical protein
VNKVDNHPEPPPESDRVAKGFGSPNDAMQHACHVLGAEPERFPAPTAALFLDDLSVHPKDGRELQELLHAVGDFNQGVDLHFQRDTDMAWRMWFGNTMGDPEEHASLTAAWVSASTILHGALEVFEKQHRALLDLVEDWQGETAGMGTETATVMDLMRWSFEQTQTPSDKWGQHVSTASHQAQHQLWHTDLDRLTARWLGGSDKSMSKNTVSELVAWSAENKRITPALAVPVAEPKESGNPRGLELGL